MPTGSVIPAAMRLRLAPPPAGFPPAGRRRGGRLVRRCPTNGRSVARVRRAGRGPVGVVPRWCLNTPSGSRPIGGITPALVPRRSAPRPVECPPVGRRHGRRPPRAIAMSGRSVARDRPASRGPVGAAPRWCPPTPSGSMPTDAHLKSVIPAARPPTGSFSASASGIPTGWSSSRRTPGPSVPYEWEIRRTRPAGESWSSWGSATVVSKYTERQSAYRRNNSGSGPPSFSASASGVPTGWSSSRQTPTSSHRYEWKISRTRPAGESWSSWGSATVVSTYTERQYAYRVGNSGSTPLRLAPPPAGFPPAGRRRGGRLVRRCPTNGRSVARGRRVGRGPVGAVPRWCLNTPSGSRRINATTRAHRPRRSARRRVGCPPAGRRRGRRLHRAIATSGRSAARGRPASRGPVGVAPRWCLVHCGYKRIHRAQYSRRINATTRARPLRRSAARPVVRLMAGRRRSRVLRRAIATYGASLARGRPAAHGPVGAAPRWWLPTPSGSMPTGSVFPAVRPHRLAPLPAGFPPAGRRRGGRLVRRCPTSGASPARGRQAAHGPIGAAPPSSIHGPHLQAVTATASNGWVLRLYPLPPSPPPSAACPPAGPRCGRRPP